MATPYTIKDQATEASAKVFMVIRIARSDGVITEAEAEEIEREAERCYRLNETDSKIRAFCRQADRIGDKCPNQPMAEQLRDIINLWEQTKRSDCVETDEPLNNEAA